MLSGYQRWWSQWDVSRFSYVFQERLCDKRVVWIIFINLDVPISFPSLLTMHMGKKKPSGREDSSWVMNSEFQSIMTEHSSSHLSSQGTQREDHSVFIPLFHFIQIPRPVGWRHSEWQVREQLGSYIKAYIKKPKQILERKDSSSDFWFSYLYA